jgi:hypothetical protein
MFLLSLLAIADEVIDSIFRNASIEGGEVTLWVIFDRVSRSYLPTHFRFAPKADFLRPGRVTKRHTVRVEIRH